GMAARQKRVDPCPPAQREENKENRERPQGTARPDHRRWGERDGDASIHPVRDPAAALVLSGFAPTCEYRISRPFLGAGTRNPTTSFSMREEITGVVHSVLNYALRLRERLEQREKPSLETEQAALKGLLKGQHEARKFRDYGME